MRALLMKLARVMLTKNGEWSKTAVMLVGTWLVLIVLMLAGAPDGRIGQGIALLGVVSGLYVGNHALSRRPANPGGDGG